jgi:hypothetical protein
MEVTGSSESWSTTSALKREVTGYSEALLTSYEITDIVNQEVTISVSSVLKNLK